MEVLKSYDIQGKHKLFLIYCDYDLLIPKLKLCSSHQVKCDSCATIVTPKYGVICVPHHFGVKYKLSVSSHPKQCELMLY